MCPKSRRSFLPHVSGLQAALQRGGILTTPPGTDLTPAQQETMAHALDAVISQVSSRRRHRLLIHNSIQNTVGLFLTMQGWAVDMEVPYHVGGPRPKVYRFDIVASKDQQVLVVEVKSAVGTRDLGQVLGYLTSLSALEEKPRGYLATDVLNYDSLVNGTLGEMIRDLMVNRKLSLMFADKYFLWICNNWSQLMLTQSPQVWFSETKVEKGSFFMVRQP